MLLRRKLAVTFALGLSWLSMLAHNLYELPLAVTDAENVGPLVVVGGLAVAAWKRPESRVVSSVMLGWTVLNLVVGGFLTVLPLSVLPFVPEQSVAHYLAHVVYSVGQLPAVLLAAQVLVRASRLRRLRAASAGRS